MTTLRQEDILSAVWRACDTFRGAVDATDGNDIGGCAEIDLPGLGLLPYLLKRLREDVFELLPHAIQAPGVVLQILHPFEVADRDSPGVRENIGEHDDAPFV